MNMVPNSKAQLVDYFSEEWLHRTSFFKDDFSRQRFLQLFCALHLVPPLATPGVHPRGSKLRMLVNIYTQKMQRILCSREIYIN
jgi:hypothetical protein